MNISEEVQNELRAKGLIAFVSDIHMQHVAFTQSQAAPPPPEIELVVYENEKWHNILQEFGSVQNVHLNAVFDRAPLTDESGFKVINGDLSDIKPLSKYKWNGDWTVHVDTAITDAEGYQYAVNWHLLRNTHKPYNKNMPTSIVRRRKWKRTMEFNTSSSKHASPFALTITFKRARLLGGGSISNSHVEVKLNGEALLYRTLSGPPDWNAVFTFGLTEIESDDQLHFAVYSKKSGLTSGGDQLRGIDKMDLRYFKDFKDKGVHQHELILTMPGSGGTKGGYLLISFELKETNLFSVVPQYSPAFEVLRRVIGNSLSPELKQLIAALDNDKADLLRILVENIITGKNILNECDIFDVVSEVEFVQGISSNYVKFDNRFHEGRIYRERSGTQMYNKMIRKDGRFRERRFPHGKLCFSKLMLLPPTSLNDEPLDFSRLLTQILYREADIQALNDRYAWSLPVCSSTYDLTHDVMCMYEQSRYKRSSSNASFYDLTIICHALDDVTPIIDGRNAEFVGHVLRFESMYDYLMTLKELSRIQHASLRSTTPVHYSTTAVYGTISFSNSDPRSNLLSNDGNCGRQVATNLGSEMSLPKTWYPITFTIDGEQDLLIIREAVHAFSSLGPLQRSISSIESYGDEDLNVVLPFTQIESVISNNSYHMHPRHNLEIHIQSVSSSHLKHTFEHCSVDIDTIDGLNHCHSEYEPQKRVVFPKGNQPTSVVLQDTHNLLLPQAAFQSSSRRSTSIHNGSANVKADPAEEFVHLTFRTPANKEHKVKEVNSQAVIPLSLLFNNSSTDLMETQLLFKNTIQHYELRLLVRSAEDLISVDLNGSSDPYFVLYFADEKGAIVELNEEPTSDTALRILHKAEKVIGGAAAKNKSNVIYKSRVLNKCVSPVWFEEVLIDSEKFHIPLRKAKFLLIEVWDKNDVLTNVALGEVFIPLLAAKYMDSETPWTAVEPKYALQVIPLQLSKHMKKSKFGYCGSNAIDGLGTLTVQFLRKELPPSVSGDHDLINLNLTMRLKPISAIDFAWPARIIMGSNGLNSGLEADLFHLDLAYDALRVFVRGDGTGPSVADDGRVEFTPSVWSSSSLSERMQMLQQCREYYHSSAPPRSYDHSSSCVLKIPYNNMHRSDIAVINTEMVIITVLLNRIVSHNDQPTIRTVAIDFLVGPCPAADLNNVLHQRIGLNAYRSQIQKCYQDVIDLETLDAITKGLQSDIYESEQHVQKMSTRHGESRVLANSILSESSSNLDAEVVESAMKGQNDENLRGKMNRPANRYSRPDGVGDSHVHVDPEAEMAKHGSVFGESSRRWSAVYWRTNMPARVLMTRKIFFQVYHWFLLDFSYSDRAESIFAAETVFNDDYVNLLLRQARARLKTGDETDFRAVEGDDSDDDDARSNTVISADGSIQELDTNSFKSRIEDIMKELDINLRMLQFYSYRNELERKKSLELANMLIYKHYLLLVAYLNEIFAEDVRNADVSIENSGEGDDAETSQTEQEGKKSTSKWRNSLLVGYHFVKFIDDVNKSIQATTGNKKNGTKEHDSEQETKKQINSVKKRDLIAFIISKDRLFEEYLSANLFANGWKFSSVPSIAKCLNFDALIQKFAYLLGKNILKWNTQALRVLMCRSSKPAVNVDVPTDVGIAVACKDSNVSSVPLPWDVNTLSDHQHEVELYISHIPETIQIQLNVQIELKRIPLKAVKENLSMSSIWRVLSINKQIASSIAKAFVALAAEYEHHLVSLVGVDDPAERTKHSHGAGGKIRNFFTNIAGTLRRGTVAGDTSTVEGSTGTSVRRGSSKTTESTDEVLCFIMSIANDCARILRRHIPRTIASFTDDYNEVDEAMHQTDSFTSDNRSVSADINAKSGDEFDTASPLPSLSLVGAVSDIERTFHNAKNAIEALQETSINYLSSQILFHSELRDYFLSGFDTHLQTRTEEAKTREGTFSSLPIALHRAVATENDPPVVDNNNEVETKREDETEEQTSPVAVINATLDAFYTFAESHLGNEEFNSVVYSCLRKFSMRYLIFVRDMLYRIRLGRSKGLPQYRQSGDDTNDKNALGGNDMDNQYFNNQQILGVQADLKMILQAYEIRDERVAEILRFLNTSIVDVLSGMLSEPEEINDLLQLQFHVSPPPFPKECFNTLTSTYERSLEDYIGFNASFSDMTEQEMRLGIFKTYTIQFSEFTVINLDDYRVIVVRVTFDGNKQQTTILSSYQIGLSTLRWKDSISFTNVQGYSSKNAIVEIVEIRPLKLRRELVLARLNIEFSDLSRFLVPESIELLSPVRKSESVSPPDGKMIEELSMRDSLVGNSKDSKRVGGHVGWYVMDDVRLEPGNASPLRIVRTKLKRSIVAGITATAVVATGGGLNNANAALRPQNDGRTHRHSRSDSFEDRTKNSYIAVLSSDRPRENEPSTQIKFRIRIFNESK